MNAPETHPVPEWSEKTLTKQKASYVKPELRLYGDVLELTRNGNSNCGNDGMGCTGTGTMGMF
jgi:hypothetical protein